MKLPATVTGTIYIVQSPYRDAPQLHTIAMDIKGWATLGEEEVTLTCPQVDPVPLMIQSLENERNAEREAYLAADGEILDRIAKLRALPAPAVPIEDDDDGVPF